MRSVVYIGPGPADPAGSAAVRDALYRALPDHDLVPLATASRSGSGLRSSGVDGVDGVVVAGVSPRDVAAALGVAALAAARQRVPVACVGLPGPAAGRIGAAALRAIAPRARLLLAADGPSATGLRAAGVPGPIRVGADPAWLAVDTSRNPAGPRAAGPSGRGDEVAVAIDGRMPARLEQDLAEALVILARTGRPIRIVPWAGAGSADDGAASRLLLSVLGAVPGGASKAASPSTLADASSLFTGAHAVVTLRHRAAHAAAAAGVPLVGVAIDPAITATANMLGQPVIHPDDVVASLAVTVERVDSVPSPDRSAVEDQIDRAGAAMRLLRLVVDPDAVSAADIEALPMEPVPWLS